MRISKIHVTNFLSHRDTKLNLDGFDAVVAVGPNGTGKSSLMVDAMLVALFGKGRSGDLDGYISNGKDLMTAEVDFAVGKNRYRVVRKRSKKTARGSSSLEFAEIDPSGSEIQQLTAGSIAETQEIIEKTLGIDFDTLVRSSVLEQGEADFFCRATPSERMELFSKIWDLDRYESMAQIARETHNTLKIKVASLEEKIIAAQTRIFEINKQKNEIDRLKSEADKEEAAAKRIEAQKGSLQKKIGAFENLQKDLEKARGDKVRAERDMAKISEQHKEVLAKIERFIKIIKNQDMVRAKVSEEEETNRAIARAEADLQMIDQEIEALRGEIERIRIEYQGRLDEIEIEQHAIEAEISEGRSKEFALQKAMIGIGRSEETLKHLRTDADKLKGIACHPDFDAEYVNEGCRFIKDAIDAKRRIPDLEAEIASARSEMEAEKEALLTQRRFNEGKTTVCLSTIGEIKKSLNEGITAKTGVINGKTSSRNDRRSEIEALKVALADIRRYTKLLPEIDLAEKELPGLKKEETDFSKRCNELVSERDRCESEIGKLTGSLDAKTDLEKELQSTCNRLTEIMAKKEELTKRIGFVEAEIAQGEALKVQIGEDEKAIEALSGDRAVYQLLEEAFKQIPYLLVARGIGSVESIANEILSMISPHGLSVKIETEKMTKTTKKLKDEINLVIQDNDGIKEYKFLSGGEKLRVAMGLRLAISEVLAHRRGMRIDSLIADEPFGPLDVEGIEDMKGAMRELKKRFRFMGIITHIEQSKDIFPTQLVFSKDAGGSKVEIQEEWA